ncbi:hypothetical protein V2J56_09300 [Georgenia sp. MJ206]|uniref:hypothetical protein n=1 Tax=Georgenia wangjunii TaxID=3117730 RepID=UPI002F26C253
MSDRAGQVYVVLGSVVASTGGGALLYAASESSGRALIAGLLLAAIGTYAVLASALDWSLPWRRTAVIRLADEAEALSRQIFAYLGDRGRDDPFFSRQDPDASDDYMWGRQIRYHDETMSRWNERFAGDALTMYDRLIASGATPVTRYGADVRFTFAHPTNALGVEECARHLAVMADQVRGRRR